MKETELHQFNFIGIKFLPVRDIFGVFFCTRILLSVFFVIHQNEVRLFKLATGNKKEIKSNLIC